ncbi:hypothetical protein HON22_02745 [Candidatus Peregrinibacteria bacterium]|jgi:hypothetical protein|nr:hypothetical protein [Candidatus Peregrinibacteria bacterium]
MQGKKTTKQDKNRFLETLTRRHGIVSLACKEAGISNRTFYNWCERDPEFAEQAEEIREIEIGIIAEDRMAEAIIVHKDMAMVRFYLQSRNRKYMQKIQTEIHDPTKELADLLCLDE